MSDDKILQKIKKLLNIAEHDTATDGDIQAAMNAVHKLMDRHHITEEDLAHEPSDDYKKVDEASFNRATSWIGGRSFAWEVALGEFVSEFVGVPYYLNNKKDWARENGILKRDKWFKEPWMGKSIVFYGIAEDAQIAKQIYDELREIIATMAYAKFNQVYVKDGGRYCEGFVTGLMAQFDREASKALIEAQQTNNTTALLLIERRTDLVQYKVDKAKDWLKSAIGIKLIHQGSNYGASGRNSAFNEGVQDGKNTDVQKTKVKKLN